MSIDIDSLLSARPADPAANGRLSLRQIIGGWRIEAYLGTGRSAEVYRVISIRFGGEGALKLLVDESQGLRDRFLREMEVLRSLAIPSLPRFFGCGVWQRRPFYVMEYLQPLFLPLDRTAIIPFMLALGKAVGDLHAAGYVHRDLKPGNILCRRNGEPVLIDLGLVRRIGETGYDGVGTLGFAAPEQLLKGESTIRADVFSLGKMLRACGGKQLGHRLRAVIRRATHEDPEERYESAAAFTAAVKGRKYGVLSAWCLVLSAGFVLGAWFFWSRADRCADRAANFKSQISNFTGTPHQTLSTKNYALTTNLTGATPLSPSTKDYEPSTNPAPSTKDYALSTSLSAALEGDVEAQVRTAECYFYGRGTATNLVEAVKWYGRAALAGNPGAQDTLGYCLLHGIGCESNSEAAVQWFMSAAEQEHLSAMNNLAYCYMNGIGVDKDEQKSFIWAKMAADQGQAPAQTFVGECYLRGSGVDKDQDLGLIWLRRAARQGNSRALKLLETY